MLTYVTLSEIYPLTNDSKVADMVETIEREYYTVSEAAALLNISRATIWRWIEAGKLPAYRLGPKNIRIKKEDLKAVIRPARAKEVSMDKEKEPENIWAKYDPEKVKEAAAKAAGTWADIDTDELIADIFRAREEGSRPESRP